MVNLLKDINDINELKKQYPNDIVIAGASVRGTPLTVLKAFEREDINNILPVIVLKGIEYNGPTEDEYYKHYLMVKDRVKELYGDSKILFEPIIYNNIDLWRLYNVGYIDHLAKTYGLVNVCLTCKAYYTLVQLHVASLFSKRLVVERKLNTKDKLSKDKLRIRLSESDKLLAEIFDIEIIKVLEERSDTDEALRLLGSNWYIPDTSPCLFSKSWRDINDTGSKNKFNIPDEMIENYVHPVSVVLIEQLNNNFKTSSEKIDDIILNHFKGGNVYE